MRNVFKTTILLYDTVEWKVLHTPLLHTYVKFDLLVQYMFKMPLPGITSRLQERPRSLIDTGKQKLVSDYIFRFTYQTSVSE